MVWKIAHCDDCDSRDSTLFMIKDDLWLSIAKKRDFLCFDCTEKRLGRKITLDDLKPCGLTDEMKLGIRIYLQGYLMNTYILVNKIVLCEPDSLAWAKWMAINDRRIALDKIGKVTVSTVFLGIDHGSGEPLVFETMIFGGKYDGECWRCPNYHEAIELHRLALLLIEPWWKKLLRRFNLAKT